MVMRAVKDILNMHGDVLANAGEPVVVIGGVELADRMLYTVQLESGVELEVSPDEVTNKEVPVLVKLVDVQSLQGFTLEHGALELAQKVFASAPAMAEAKLIHRDGELIQVKTNRGAVFSAMPCGSAGSIVLWRVRAAEGLLTIKPSICDRADVLVDPAKAGA